MRHLHESTPTFSDWEGVHDAVADAYFPHALRPRSEGSAARSELEVVDLSLVRVAHIRFGATVDISTDHAGAVAINLQLRGSMESVLGGTSVTTEPGQAAIFPADTPARLPAWTPDSDVLGLRVDEDYLARESERVLARKGLVLPRVVDLSGPEGRAWVAMARTTLRNARDCGGVLYQDPRVAESVASMLVTGLLLAAVPEEAAASTRPRPVHRVIEAMEADPARPWSPADLSEIAGCSVRRLQQAFREHVGTSPLAYLHDLRLDRVRVDLAAGAGPVTDVAMRWGLHHMGRFAADYKRRFGELPSQTAARAA